MYIRSFVANIRIENESLIVLTRSEIFDSINYIYIYISISTKYGNLLKTKQSEMSAWNFEKSFTHLLSIIFYYYFIFLPNVFFFYLFTCIKNWSLSAIFYCYFICDNFTSFVYWFPTSALKTDRYPLHFIYYIFLFITISCNIKLIINRVSRNYSTIFTLYPLRFIATLFHISFFFTTFFIY